MSISENVSTEEFVKSEKIEPSTLEDLPEKISEEKVVKKIDVENVGNTKSEPVDIKKIDEIKLENAALEELKQGIAAKQGKKISDSVPCCPRSKEKIVRNHSDIFSLKDCTATLQTSIFSVNGSPSRRVFRKQEPAGHVFQKNEEPPSDQTSTPRPNRITRENYNDEKRPSSSCRNPLTGTGLSSNDEYKSKGTKRKDGNPLLGLGYEDVASTKSQQRIPPGGFSHKLW